MLPELEKLREMRSKRYAKEKLNTAFWGCLLYTILAILIFAWAAVVIFNADKNLEGWCFILGLPLSIVLIYYMNSKFEYWKNTID